MVFWRMLPVRGFFGFRYLCNPLSCLSFADTHLNASIQREMNRRSLSKLFEDSSYVTRDFLFFVLAQKYARPRSRDLCAGPSRTQLCSTGQILHIKPKIFKKRQEWT